MAGKIDMRRPEEESIFGPSPEKGPRWPHSAGAESPLFLTFFLLYEDNVTYGVRRRKEKDPLSARP